MKKFSRSEHKQQGATLVEILVSLFVFSVGALGIAALQTVTIVRSDDVKQRSLAIWKAQELADRIRSSRSIDNPNGFINNYITEVGSQSIDAIGSVETSGGFSCPDAEVTRCDDTSSSAASSCSIDQIVAFDVWSVLCDPISGASYADTVDDSDGVNKLKNLDVVLLRTGNEIRLYFEWQARAADNNEDLTDSAGGEKKINTQLCGDDVEVDTRLDTYCLRFL